jgi:preprotein translocase subunit YajC
MTAFSAFAFVLADAAATNAPANGGGGLLGSQWVMPVMLVVMFYFLLIRPQSQQRKALAARIAALQPGSKVVTNSGVHALVHSVKERTVMLKVAEGTMIEFDKAAIAVIQPKESDAKK